MKAMGFVLSVLLSLAHGGISDALSASGPPLSQAPVSPSSAATPPSLYTPAGGPAREPRGSPRNRDSTPMPTPAPTNHYAGPAENSTGHHRLVIDHA